MDLLKDQINLRKPIPTLVIPQLDSQQQYDFLEFLRSLYNQYYAKLVVKKFMLNNDIIDEFYEYYTEILSSTPVNDDVLTYNIGRPILIRENPYLIAANGTTGFRTWEASSYLGEYIQGKFKDKTILELGCGTGLVGLSVCNENSVIFTDRDLNLLHSLNETMKLNGLPDTTVLESSEHEKLKDKSTSICQLQFGEWSREVDIVLGSDITYAPEILPDLIKCIHQFLNKGAIVYIGATIRNEETFRDWEERLKIFDWTEVKFNGVIKIYEIRLK
ncbi:protein-lysine N-methyltransferase Efm3p [[Candida] jaroonii]|uniref:Protein-lysine N-methyltransferase Efm3p n=1 Tax=[Candida] jaroonii TaxID=467808 RepID=A0ACA9Y7U4_9ASCO|nr:protein-lysine N-methyltransferase Efm3p [[Candida] jaroonii]